MIDHGWVSRLQRYSLHDGPGIRTTVFLKGCPLRCWWCHNPENRSAEPEILVVENRCLRCGQCVQACPNNQPEPDFRTETRETGRIPSPSPNPNGIECGEPASRRPRASGAPCTRCGACVAACPTGARHLVGRKLSVREVLREVIRDTPFYDDSGGGVTLSGGEPLMQHEFAEALLTGCRAHGIHTAVDTCGYGPKEYLLALARVTDLFLYDLKLMTEQDHIRYTGVSNKPILENLQALAALHERLWIRIPIIPGLNDSEVELAALARFVKSLPKACPVNLLSYHKTGIAKFPRLGLAYPLADVAPPSPEHMQAVRAAFAASGVEARFGG